MDNASLARLELNDALEDELNVFAKSRPDVLYVCSTKTTIYCGMRTKIYKIFTFMASLVALNENRG